MDLIGINLANSGTYNKYAYVWNNPVCLVDPFGLQPEPIPGATATVYYISGAGGKKTGTIFNIFILDGEYYVSFDEALSAYGVSKTLSTKTTYGKRTRQHSIYSPGRLKRASVTFSLADGYVDMGNIYVNIFDLNRTSGNYDYDSAFSPGTFYCSGGKYLINLEYFHRIMCSIYRSNSESDWLPKVNLPVTEMRLSYEGQKALIIIEIANTYAKEKGLLNIENGVLKSIKPHDVQDNAITVGIGDWLMQADYDWYWSKHSLSRSHLENNPLDISIALEKFRKDVKEMEDGMNEFYIRDKVRVEQHEFDAFIILRYVTGTVGQDIALMIRDGISKYPRDEWWRVIRERKGSSSIHSSAWDNRTNIETRILFGEGYSTMPEVEPYPVIIPGFGAIEGVR